MYIIVFEDGIFQKTEKLDVSLLFACDEDNVCDLIDIAGPENPLIRSDGGWIAIPKE